MNARAAAECVSGWIQRQQPNHGAGVPRDGPAAAAGGPLRAVRRGELQRHRDRDESAATLAQGKHSSLGTEQAHS